MKKTSIGISIIALAGMVLAGAVYIKTQEDYVAALQHYREKSQHESENVANSVETALKLIYQGIRTISLLPSVRSVDRYGASLDENARASIGQIYGNMVSNVAVSEIYIVPSNLDPEKIDPNTGELESPILMFDSYIAPTKPEKHTPITTVEQALETSEVEIHEYRLLKKQMGYLQQHYADNKQIKGLDLPFISGSAVLTCDNSQYEETKENADRTGMVFSVPFFDPSGKLAGTISAIILSNVLRDLLPNSNYTLINPTYQYSIAQASKDQSALSGEWVMQGKPDPNLLFSSTINIPTADHTSQWMLWVGYPDSKFYDSSDVAAIRNFSYVGYGFAATFTMIGIAIMLFLRHTEKVKKIQRELAEQERVKAIHSVAERFEFAVQDIVTQVADAANRLHTSVESVDIIAAETKTRSAKVAIVSKNAADASMQVSQAAQKLSASIAEISEQSYRSSAVASDANQKAQIAKTSISSLANASEQVSDILGTINSIAARINLLALNATIEAARAGEAGKGFAVVAIEVKDLANQVASATQQITTHMQAMQTSTESSVAAVMDIISVITQVLDSTQRVASAVEEQSTVTQHIANNVELAAHGTQEISQHITTVQTGADSTGNTIKDVMETAKTLNGQSQALKHRIDDFIDNLLA